MTKRDIPALPRGGACVVVGATGGIGQALAEAASASGAFARVLRLSRAGAPGGHIAPDITVDITVDITDEASVKAAAASVADVCRVTPLRLVLDATGFLHDNAHQPEKSWRDLDPAHLAKAFSVNAIGPALLMKHFLPLLPREGKAVFATLSAKVGSIADNRLGGWYAYRASKAALNQLVRTAAVELARRRPDAIAVALHPGTVDTRLSQPFAKTGLAVRPPEEAAALLLGVVERLTPAMSGGFYDYRGDPLPW
ncbi:MAG: SDR family oxidoreductase [Azospirillaceae bacterium]